MAQNNIRYEGRIINNNGQSKVARSRAGNVIVNLLIAEQFREKNKNAPQKFRDPGKTDEDWVDTTTAWHRVQLVGAAAEEIAKNPEYNHGAIVEISATYTEDANEWVDKGGVTRTSRSETVFLDNKDNLYWCDIKVSQNSSTRLVPREEFYRPLWDGKSELPGLGGGGQGLPPAPEYGDNEGF
jgi:hypothetical protein